MSAVELNEKCYSKSVLFWGNKITNKSWKVEVKRLIANMTGLFKAGTTEGVVERW